MRVEAAMESLPALTDYVEETLADAGMLKAAIKMSIALEEMFTNIVKFSGASYADVTCTAENGEACLTLEDDGAPYDPWQRSDPDITLSAEEREIGGLGIYMVKKSMTEVGYAFQGGKNIVTLRLRP